MSWRVSALHSLTHWSPYYTRRSTFAPSAPVSERNSPPTRAKLLVEDCRPALLFFHHFISSSSSSCAFSFVFVLATVCFPFNLNLPLLFDRQSIPFCANILLHFISLTPPLVHAMSWRYCPVCVCRARRHLYRCVTHVNRCWGYRCTYTYCSNFWMADPACRLSPVYA